MCDSQKNETPAFDAVFLRTPSSLAWIENTSDQPNRPSSQLPPSLAPRGTPFTDIAARWWPLGRTRGIVIDPKRQFGQPIDDATGVWRWPVMEQFISAAAPGSMFEVSVNRRSGFAPLAV
jgi:hypothetical protein